MPAQPRPANGLSPWLKPNLKGFLLWGSFLFFALNLLPMPMVSYSAMTCRGSVSWPWPWALAAAAISAALYALSMRIGSSLPRAGAARTLTGPVPLVPLAVLLAIAVGKFLYVPPEIHGDLEKHLFLQGSTDWGGGALFAAFVSLYVFFGFAASWHLALALRDEPDLPFGKALLRSLWILKFHLLLFAVAGTAPWRYDARVTPNDFRNLFLFASLVYSASVVWIVALRRARIPLPLRLAAAPAFVLLWLLLGSDGNTARAGQLVQAGQDPLPVVRGVRHGIMLSWHRLCDGLLGDVDGR